MTESRSVAPWEWGWWGRGGEVMRRGQEGVEGITIKEHKRNWGVMNMLIILIIVMVSRVNIYVKINQIEYFKYVQLL